MIQFAGFLDQNEDRAYPFSERGGRTSTVGAVIPDDFLVDASITITDGAIEVPWLSDLSITSSAIRGTFSVETDSGVERVGSFTVPVLEHDRFDTYVVISDQGATVGQVSVGKLESIISSFRGVLSFSATQTPLSISVIHLPARGVEGVAVVSGGVIQGVASGLVELVAGDNIRLSMSSEGDSIRIDAIPGENLDDCPDRVPCIQKINGHPPDQDGEFSIVGSECVSITSEQGRILIRDLCASTCCDCDDFQEMVRGLERVRNNAEDLRQYLTNQDNRIQQVVAALLLQLQQ